ncbi:MAG: tRNA pseudouridine(55) synthase TruB [Parcubacteria group bacterium]
MDIIAVYKPKGPTSHDMIDKIRRITGVKRVGHAGTLDPLASGVLVVGIGREATRTLDAEVKKEKEYIATIKFGETSETDDEEGILMAKHGIYSVPSEDYPTSSQIETTMKKFIGEISQIPPAYSALKIKGTPAYKLARSGKKVNLEPRKVFIKEIEILKYEWPLLKIKVVCGPGVYIRSLARDIGEALGVGGYMSALERTRVGDFTVEQAIDLDKEPAKILKMLKNKN